MRKKGSYYISDVSVQKSNYHLEQRLGIGKELRHLAQICYALSLSSFMKICNPCRGNLIAYT